MAALAQAALADKATDDDWNELYSLLAVYADRLLGASAAERPAAELRESREKYPDIDQPRFSLEYDPSLTRKPPLRFAVETSAARRQAERLYADMSARFGSYWTVLPRLRELFDRLGGRPLEDFLRLVRSTGAGSEGK